MRFRHLWTLALGGPTTTVTVSKPWPYERRWLGLSDDVQQKDGGD